MENGTGCCLQGLWQLGSHAFDRAGNTGAESSPYLRHYSGCSVPLQLNQSLCTPLVFREYQAVRHQRKE